jgi:AcrR family transcriptional regulator
MVRRGRSNDPEAMRRRVLDVAAAAFQTRGYHSTSTHDIMREAGVTGGALHHHFPTKKALGLAVIRDRVAQAVEQTWIEPIRSAPTAAAGISQVFEQIAATIDARGTVGPGLSAEQSRPGVVAGGSGIPARGSDRFRALADDDRGKAARRPSWRRPEKCRPREPGDLCCGGLLRGHGDGESPTELEATWDVRAAASRVRATRSSEIPPLARESVTNWGHDRLSLPPLSISALPSRTGRPELHSALQEARLASPYPTCAASIPSAATRIPCACSWRTGRPPHPCRIAHSRTLR